MVYFKDDNVGAVVLLYHEMLSTVEVLSGPDSKQGNRPRLRRVFELGQDCPRPSIVYACRRAADAMLMWLVSFDSRLGR